MPESKIITINLNDVPSPSDERLRELAADDRPIDYSDIPEIPDAVLKKAVRERNGRLKLRKVSLSLEGDLVDWFKDQCPQWQHAMGQVLRNYMLERTGQ